MVVQFHRRNYKAGFIGGGHICEAMIRGLIISGYIDPGMIYVSTHSQERRDFLHKRLGVRTNITNIKLCEKVDVVFLSVRPMEILPLCKEIRGSIEKDTLIVTVAAGIKTEDISNELHGHKNIIRIMPNLPTRVRAGTIASYIMQGCDKELSNDLKELLTGCGEYISIENESLIDPITVLSGSAPAYYIMVADALIEYGIKEGIPEDVCKKLVLDTIEGSAQWALQSELSPKELWPRVVTKGGVTAAGMKIYKNKKLIEILIEGFKAATEKARSI